MWNWDKNLEHIRANERLIDRESFAVLANEKLYSPEHRESLHDCRLVKIEVINGGILDFVHKKEREREINLTLIGAYYDLFHIISYKNVKNYSVTENFEPSDLIEHYFSLSGEFITHTLLFHFGTIGISFGKISIKTAKI